MTQATRAKCAQLRRSTEDGQALITAWRQSGLSRVAFAREHQVGAHLLTYWAKKFPAADTTQPPCEGDAITAMNDFVQLPVAAAAPAEYSAPPAIEVRLAHGVVVRVMSGVEPALVQQILRAVGCG